MNLLGIAFVIALADWFAVGRGIKRLRYITRPGVILLLFAWLWVTVDLPDVTGNTQAAPLIWFGWALGFSLLGDVLLMLPRQQIIGGLAAFMLTNLAFVFGFGGLGFSEGFLFPWILLTFFVVATGLRLNARILRGVRNSDEQRLAIPVAIYSLVISAMLIAALSSLIKSEWRFEHAYLVSAGGLMLYISNVFLAWERFVKPIPRAKIKVVILYHLGQFGLVVGALLHFQQFI